MTTLTSKRPCLPCRHFFWRILLLETVLKTTPQFFRHFNSAVAKKKTGHGESTPNLTGTGGGVCGVEFNIGVASFGRNSFNYRSHPTMIHPL